MIRNRKYLDRMRTLPCLICGTLPSEPAHIGTAGRGIKSPDDEAIPLCHAHHAACHTRGEITTLRNALPDAMMRRALRALAHELYREEMP